MDSTTVHGLRDREPCPHPNGAHGYKSPRSKRGVRDGYQEDRHRIPFPPRSCDRSTCIPRSATRRLRARGTRKRTGCRNSCTGPLSDRVASAGAPVPVTAQVAWSCCDHEGAPGSRFSGTGSCASASAPGRRASRNAPSRHCSLCKERATARTAFAARKSMVCPCTGGENLPSGLFLPTASQREGGDHRCDLRALGAGRVGAWIRLCVIRSRSETTCPWADRARRVSCEASCDRSQECERPGCDSLQPRRAPAARDRAQRPAACEAIRPPSASA